MIQLRVKYNKSLNQLIKIQIAVPHLNNMNLEMTKAQLFKRLIETKKKVSQILIQLFICVTEIILKQVNQLISINTKIQLQIFQKW